MLNKFLKFFEPGIYISGGAFSNYFSFFKKIVNNGFKTYNNTIIPITNKVSVKNTLRNKKRDPNIAVS